jgi:Domain of unknown function (DUF4924)
MIVAQEKRKENISEYLLYMFQIEDLIRAFNFDIELIDKSLIAQYDQSYEIKRDIREWYVSLIQMMKENNLATSGHIPMLRTQIEELNDLHLRTLENTDDKSYAEIYSLSKSAIEELKFKSNSKEISDIEAGLNGLYGFLMLKLQKKAINPETAEAISSISQLMAELSLRYHKAERGESEI